MHSSMVCGPLPGEHGNPTRCCCNHLSVSLLFCFVFIHLPNIFSHSKRVDTYTTLQQNDCTIVYEALLSVRTRRLVGTVAGVVAELTVSALISGVKKYCPSLSVG